MGAREANIVTLPHGVPRRGFSFSFVVLLSRVSAGYGVGPVDLVRVAHVRAGAVRHVGGGHVNGGVGGGGAPVAGLVRAGRQAAARVGNEVCGGGAGRRSRCSCALRPGASAR